MSVIVKRNLGSRIYDISEKLGVPRVTVESIIKEYLNSLMVSALNGENIVIDNIMSIKIVQSVSSGEIMARGRVSPALKSRLLEVTKLSDDIDS